jgi:hypothetical protein
MAVKNVEFDQASGGRKRGTDMTRDTADEKSIRARNIPPLPSFLS